MNTENVVDYNDSSKIFTTVKLKDLVVASNGTSELVTINNLTTKNLNWSYWISLNRNNLNIPEPVSNNTVDQIVTNMDKFYKYILPSTTLYYLPFQVDNDMNVYFVFICDGFGLVYLNGTLTQTFERTDAPIPDNSGNYITKYFWPSTSQLTSPIMLEKNKPYVLTVSLSTQNITKSWRAGFSLFAFTQVGLTNNIAPVTIKSPSTSPSGTYTVSTLDTKISSDGRKWFTINC